MGERDEVSAFGGIGECLLAGGCGRLLIDIEGDDRVVSIARLVEKEEPDAEA